MNVLSLFDGISCGRVALDRAGIKYNKYFASEIDRYAIQIALKNYPDTIQLGDIQFVTGQQFDAIGGIDLFIGGSPCQGFSFAGKQLNFEDPRSALFFEFVRLKKELKPKWFLLENVKMKKEYQDIISEYLGVEPIEINSALVSAQNRKRLYWTNISGVKHPEDKGVLLKDVLEYVVDEKYYYSEKAKSYLDRSKINRRFINYADNNKSNCLTANFCKSLPYNVYVDREKSFCIDATYANKDPRNYNKSQGQIVFCIAQRGRYTEDGSIEQQLEPRFDNKTNSLTTVQKDNMLLNDYSIRRLTPIECERLQTLPDNYTQGVSDTQRYKALGNGWTVDVLAHIFSYIK